MSKIKVAVIGTGYLGSLHAKIYKEIPGCELAGICDSNKQRCDEISAGLQVPGFTDHTALFGKIDAVSIAVPTLLHHKIALDFLSRGIHTLVEKPFTSNLKEADSLIRAAQKNRLILQVGHIERFNPAFSCAHKFFKNPYFIECHRLSLFPNRSLDIGVVLDLMIHDIDIILGLVNSPIKRIEAVGANVLTEYEDIANARITFKNGCVCNLTASRISDETMRKIRIFLKDAYISLDYKSEQAYIYRKGPSGIFKEALEIEKDHPLKKELSSFIDCVSNHKQPIVDGKEARQALKVALKIKNLIWKNPRKY
ncbi:MAG: Gfo/Idh/MocA family oxidoreductase [Candidatus Omnitrophica bacterium]|nr:Gfo/Idh/MocA family oxidoreductase [Candidatus Omnitrophota bacterium]MDD5079503.1 Gfo/Idh/MocA family oxidoreductase [Candidatus Omnitrophota bacterium]